MFNNYSVNVFIREQKVPMILMVDFILDDETLLCLRPRSTISAFLVEEG